GLVAHHDGVDDAIGVEGELVLAENAHLFGADHVAFLRVKLAGEDLHEGGLAGSVGAGETVAAARDEGDGHVFKENFCAVAHAYVADRNHGGPEVLSWGAAWRRKRTASIYCNGGS